MTLTPQQEAAVKAFLEVWKKRLDPISWAEVEKYEQAWMKASDPLTTDELQDVLDEAHARRVGRISFLTVEVP